MAADAEQWLLVPFDETRCLVADPHLRWMRENGWELTFSYLLEEKRDSLSFFIVRLERVRSSWNAR